MFHPPCIVLPSPPALSQLWYSNKDRLVNGEATLNVAKGQKVNCTFNQDKLLTAKYTYVKGDITAEPSYNFVRKAPAVALTKKMGSKDTLKLSYDIKSEVCQEHHQLWHYALNRPCRSCKERACELVTVESFLGIFLGIRRCCLSCSL